MMKLSELQFTDLYLPESHPMSGHLFPGPEPLPEGMSEAIARLCARIGPCMSESTPDFALTEDGIRFRGMRMPTATGNYIVLRRMPDAPWTLTECGFSSVVQSEMLAERLRNGGLVIVAGLPGSGKSTTCAALIVERLQRFGGFCISIEDPVEMPLHGMHGKGICLQREVRAREEFSDAVHDSLRGYPTQPSSGQSDTMLLIGEVRDARTAELALRASVDGRLVIFSMHAGTIVQSLQRLLSLGSQNLGSNESRQLLASGLRMAINQRLVTDASLTGSTENSAARSLLRYTLLLDTDRAASTIRSNSSPIESLGDEVTLQQQLLRKRSPIPTRRIR